MTTKSENKMKRRLEGVVVSTKMQKTITVRIDRKKLHPKYKKYFIVSKKYQVHSEDGDIKKGDKVIFEECKPFSKSKKWRLGKR
jgi:small subunit ribosomal protein S17